MASTESFISWEKLEPGIALISLAKEPVNSMNLSFWRRLLEIFEAVEADPEVKGVIFQSKLKKPVFTAGLDIRELHAPSTSEEKLKEFWRTLTRTLTKVYCSRLATAAAINGACPAGGCCLSLCCDYRVITSSGSMGLNEVAIGLAVPKFWCDLMALVGGQRAAEKALLGGEMMPAQQLLELSFVDAVVQTPEELVPKALDQVRKWIKPRGFGYVWTKGYLRKSFAQRWWLGADWEANEVWNSISDPQTVAAMDKMIGRAGAAAKPKSKL